MNRRAKRGWVAAVAMVLCAIIAFGCDFSGFEGSAKSCCDAQILFPFHPGALAGPPHKSEKPIEPVGTEEHKQAHIHNGRVEPPPAGHHFTVADTSSSLNELPVLTTAEKEKLKVNSGVEKSAILPLPVVLIPGFAGSRMNTWASKLCTKMGSLGFSVGDRVWLDTAKVVGLGSCWLECMMLHPYNMTEQDNGCKLRPVTGTEAIGELDPGLITGRLTSIWQIIIKRLAETFDYDPNTLNAAPYDFRVPPSVLEERDSYFLRLMRTFETTVTTREKQIKALSKMNSTRSYAHGGAIVICHSMGNNVFRYFLEWLKHEKGVHHYQAWIDRHISAYYAVGAPLLGSIESIKAIYTGLTFGLPISAADARRMGGTFGSTAWMFPMSPKFKHYKPEKSYEWRSYAAKLIFPPNSTKTTLTPEQKKNVERLASKSKAYHPREFNQMWKDLAAFEEMGDRVQHWLDNFYKKDPAIKYDYGWERPPIKRVYCVYGVNMKTELAHTYTGTLSPNPKNPDGTDLIWTSTDIVYEDGPRIYSANNDPEVESYVPGRKSGDLTVPYSSLSLCHEWLGEHVNVTRIPQRVYFEDDVNSSANEPMITFYESASHKIKNIRGEEMDVETAVWEIDNADHRGVIQSDQFLRELREELYFHFESTAEMIKKQEILETASKRFASKSERIPLTDEDCAWDYLAARCKWLEYCEYDFHFGDLTLDMSCRLRERKNVDDHFKSEHRVNSDETASRH